MKIAIIDDSDADRYLARRVVKATFGDADILEYESALDAVDPIRRGSDEHEPFVVFLDINMPRMNGFEFLDVVDEDIDSPPVVVLMLTSSSAKSDRDTASKYGCVKGFIEKPLTREHLDELAAALSP